MRLNDRDVRVSARYAAERFILPGFVNTFVVNLSASSSWSARWRAWDRLASRHATAAAWA